MTQPQYLTNCELRTIDCANGAVEYLWLDFADAEQQDVTADPVAISLGTYETPGTWHPADLVEPNGAVWKIRAALLIGSTLTYPPGIYTAWVRVTDSPEVIPKRADNLLIEIT
jgi:hypothetical protein